MNAMRRICPAQIGHTNQTNSNFRFNLPWWDRLFGTYRAQPAAGHEAMAIGVDAFRTRAGHAARSLVTRLIGHTSA